MLANLLAIAPSKVRMTKMKAVPLPTFIHPSSALAPFFPLMESRFAITKTINPKKAEDPQLEEYNLSICYSDLSGH